MRKTKFYYQTSQTSPTAYRVDKLEPMNLEPEQTYTVSKLEGNNGFICNCPAMKVPCRHVQMITMHMKDGVLQKHAPYDFDNRRYYQQPKNPFLDLLD